MIKMSTAGYSMSFFTLFFVLSSIHHGYVNCDCIHPPIEVTTISLHPTPKTFNKTHSLSMDLKARRELCKRILITERLEDKHEIFLLKDEDFYVAPAHAYSFDGGNDFQMAIQCPTVPVMYVSAENKAQDSLDYTIRVQKSQFGCCNFTFENVYEVNAAGVPESITGQRILAESQLFKTGVEDRWRMCRDARNLLQNKIDWKTAARTYFFRGPALHQFWVSLRFDESETRCAVRCPTIPDLYLSERPGSRNHVDDCREILITLVATTDDTLQD